MTASDRVTEMFSDAHVKSAGAKDVLKKIYRRISGSPVKSNIKNPETYEELVKAVEHSGEAASNAKEIDNLQRAFGNFMSRPQIAAISHMLPDDNVKPDEEFSYIPDTFISADNSPVYRRGLGRLTRYLSNTAFNAKDSAVRALYRLGVFPDDAYAKHIGDVKTHILENGNYAVSPADAEKTVNGILKNRLYGKGTSRGDIYENRASRHGVLSTSFAGRTIGANQPSPEELGVISNADPASWDGGSVVTGWKVPGAATAMDIGGYMAPYLGKLLYARDIAQDVSDGNYGQATAKAVAPGVASRVYRVTSRPLVRLSSKLKNSVQRGLALLGSTITSVATGLGTSELPDAVGKHVDKIIKDKADGHEQ